MKILSISAGAAGMYCGSCIRDNALAAELKARGHDVILLPIYTPTLTDETNVSARKVLFGGISVYLQQHSSIFRRTPRLLDRLWDSRFALKAASNRSISVTPRLLGEMTVSMLEGEDGALRKEFSKMEEWLRHERAPDIATIPNSLLISLARPMKRATKAPVLCTLQGEDLFLDNLEEPWRSRSLELIRAQVPHLDGFISVSNYCAERMTRLLHIPEAKMHVVPLGINLDGHQPIERRRGDRFIIGYFARIAPEKGLHVLCDAYRRLRANPEFGPACIEAAGYLAPEHRDYLRSIEDQMKTAGQAEEFHYRGSLDREQKIDFYRRADVVSVPSVFEEPKGLYVLEAMANGVPVIQPAHGAFPELIARTGGGLIVPAGDPQALADGILRLWRDEPLARELGRRGAESVRLHHGVANTAQATIGILTLYLARSTSVAS